MADTQSVILVEGQSDRAAVLALAERQGRDLGAERVEIVAMGGATNLEHYVDELGVLGRDLDLVGLCDAPEAERFERVLGEGQFAICSADLEDELIRALGVEEMINFIAEQGEGKAFHIFQKQPAQRDRTVEQHLHRFCGTHSGRKTRYADAIVRHLPLDRAPTPLSEALALV